MVAVESIISAAITGAVTLIVCLITNATQQQKTRALLEYKMEQLTKQVEKHNRVIERVYDLEKRDAVEEEEIRVINHRIADLENYHK